MRRGTRPLAALLGTALAMGMVAATAQEARTEPAPGDLVWALAGEPPFNDLRVQTAFALLVDARAVMEAAGGWPDVQLLPAEEELRTAIQQPGAAADAPVLFLAAGLGPGSLTPAGECRVWVSESTDDPAAAVREAAASALAAEVRRVIAEHFEVDVPPCTFTDSAAEAHILVWGASEEPPSLAGRDEGTLFSYPPPPAGVPAGTGGGGGGDAPAPAVTGGAGPADAGRGARTAHVLFSVLAGVTLVTLGRVATGRPARGGRSHGHP